MRSRKQSSTAPDFGALFHDDNGNRRLAQLMRMAALNPAESLSHHIDASGVDVFEQALQGRAVSRFAG